MRACQIWFVNHSIKMMNSFDVSYMFIFSQIIHRRLMKSESCVHPSPELATDQSALSSHTRVAGTDSVSSDTRAPQHVRLRHCHHQVSIRSCATK